MNNQIKTAEQIVSRAKEEILKEANRIEEACLHSAKGNFITASFWSGFHHILGTLTVVLAAAAGTSFFSNGEGHNILAGIISLITAGLSAILTFLNPNERATNHLNAGNNYDSLQNKARIFRTIDCWREESEQVLSEKLKYLSEEKNRINHNSPQVAWLAYLIAKRGIKKGEGSYDVDKEKIVNKIRDQVPRLADGSAQKDEPVDEIEKNN
jgi:hypothetical protein